MCEKYKDRVDPSAILPTVNWRETSSSLTTAGSHGPSATGVGDTESAEVN